MPEMDAQVTQPKWLQHKAIPAANPLPLSMSLGWGIGTMAVAAQFNTVNVLLLRHLFRLDPLPDREEVCAS